MRKILAIFSLALLFSLFIVKPEQASATGGDMHGGKGNHTGEILPGGPYETRTGWLYYMIAKDGSEQTTKTIGITNSFKPSGIEYNLTSRFNISVSRLENNSTPAPWGLPYNVNNSGRGPAVKKYLLGKEPGSKNRRAYNLIYKNFSKDKAEAWERGEELLVFEPFFWHVIKRNEAYFCGTTRTWAEKHKSLGWDTYTSDTETRYFVYKIEPHSTFLIGKKESKDAGFKIYKANGYHPRSQLIYGKSNLGIGLVWSGNKPTGTINTYNKKDSPGKPEIPTKKKKTTGKCKIIKQYWVKETDANGKVEYKNVGAETHKDFSMYKTTKNIQITDEFDKPTEKTTKGYKLVGWFTGQDLIDDTSDVVDNPKPNGELKSRMAEADNEGFRSGKGADLITLGLDKVTKKKYKGEDTLVVVFLREEKTEGVIDTYNNNDSPGDPEDPSNDKTKQGKKKILKQYWDEIEVYKNGVKTETKYKHVGTYKEDNVVKHVKVTEEPKEYKIIGWFTGRDKKVEKNPKPRTDVATEVSLGIKHGTSAKSKVTLGKDEQIITVVYIRTIRKDTTLQKDETGDYKISESKISIRDGFDSKNRLNRILSNTFVWKSPAIANKKCFDHGGHGHHFFCTKYEHTHTEGPCYYYKTYTSHYYEDEDGKKVKKEKKKKKKVKTCNLYEHTHSNACWDTPCGGWDWKDTSILIGVYNSKGYNYPSVLSAYNQHCPKDTMDYVTPGMAGRESDSDSRGTLSSWKTNHSGFNYKFILYRGKDQLTLCDFKNNSFSPSAKGFLGGLSNNSSYNFKSQNTPRKTRLDKEQYKDAFSADIVGGSLGWGLDQTTVYGPRFGAAGMCADQYSPHRFQDYSKFSANATVNIDVYWANKESPDFDGKIEDYVNSKERHMLSAGQIKFVPYVLMQYQDKQGAFKRVDVLSEYKRTLNPYDYIQ